MDLPGEGLALAAVDFNNDGSPDLLVAGAVQDLGWILLFSNNGSGLLVSRDQLKIGADPTAITSGDLDNDGDLDFAVAEERGRVSILFNDGSGSFTDPISLTDGPVRVRGIAAADLDRDGDADLVTGVWEQNRVHVLLNDGHGAFPKGKPLNFGIPGNVFGVIKSLAVGDLDRDGDADLVVGGKWLERALMVFLNKGDASFTDGQSFRGLVIEDLQIEDLNADGSLDLVSTNDSLQNLTLFLSEADLTYAKVTDLEAAESAGATAALDIDNDGDLDLAVTTGFSLLVVFLNDGRGRFERKWLFVSGGGGIPQAGDLNGDGKVDIVTQGASIIFNLTIPPASRDGNHNGVPDECETVFLRGDANADGEIDVADAIFIAEHLFLTRRAPRCQKSADADDSGSLELLDAVDLLGYIFKGEAGPRSPFPDCGIDPLEDLLTCFEYPACRPR